MKKNTTFDEIPYFEGTFDTPKAKEIRSAILSSSITNVEIEGSIRAGKDVIALNAYAEFLMLTPDTKHLVTHVTTNSAKETVLDANGFGIRYLIPHGYEVADDNRVVYHFTDWNGVEKELYFYGLSNKNDHEKFRGISFGSHYANEATKQNVAGLKAAKDRTVAAKWRKIIYTQNPESPSNGIYTEIEKPLIASELQCAEIYSLRDKYQNEYNQAKLQFAAKEKEKSVEIVRNFLSKKHKSSVEFLTKSEKVTLRKLILSNQYEIRNEREEYLFNNYGISSKNFVFYEGGDNPNHVKNGLDFRYIHMTLDDNPSVTSIRKAEVESGYDKNSLHYKRDILGLRAMAEGAIYDNITNDNYYYEDLPKNGLLGHGWLRIISCDYGVKNDFVLLDGLLHIESKTLFIDNEFRFKGRDENELRSPTNELYVQFAKDFINSRENGNYSAFLYDPSARAYANSLNAHNIRCQRAINVVKYGKRARRLDKENQDKRIYKENMGIGLVKDGIGFKKIRINHKNCGELVKEMEGYSYDSDKLKVGIEQPLKIADHGCIIENSKITTQNGKKKIKDIKQGDVLLTINETTHNLEYDKVEDCMLTRKNADVYEIELENGMKLQCTADHKIFTKEGKKELQYLTLSDKIIVEA